jgi:hypothetical protein
MKTLKKLIIIPALAVVCILLVSCEDIWNRCVEGNGDRGMENRSLSPFNRIEVNGDFEVQIVEGGISSAEIRSDENLIDLIVTHVSGNTLIVEMRDGVCINPTDPIEITVTTPNVEEITLNGSGIVYSYELDAEELSLTLAGSGSITCDDVIATTVYLNLEGSGVINCDQVSENINTQLEGSGEILVSGETISADHKIIGSGKIKASQVISDQCVVYISGSGIVETHVIETLDITIIGSGIVYFSGDPIVDTYISGSGQVIER